MAIRLSTAEPDFEARFAAFLATKREVSEEVDAAAAEIIAAVRRDGDAALVALSQRFDRVDLGAIGIRVTDAELDAAAGLVDAETMAALTLARDRIEARLADLGAAWEARAKPEHEAG